MRWLSVDVILAIHDRQIAEHGGSEGIRDQTLLESALARPQQGDPLPDIAALAASITAGIARNHPFVDGNKRSAFVTGVTLLALNGAELTAPAAERFANILALAEGLMNEAEYADWLRANLQTEADAVHEPPAKYG